MALDKNAPQEVINHLLAKDLSKENIYTPSLFMHIKFILVKILIKIRRKSMKHGIQSSRRKLGRSINKRNIIQPLKEISSSIGNDFNSVKVNKIANSLWVIEEKEI